MITFKKVLFLAFVTAYSLTVSAETITLKVCEWEGYIMPWESEFKAYAKQRGIDVDLELYPEYLSSPEQIFTLVRGKKCDIVTPTHNYFSQRNNQLFLSLLPLDFSRIPNYAHVIPELKDLKYKEYKGQSFAVPLLGGSYGLAYNADKVKEPTSFDVLFDPANKCKITLTKAQFAANFYLATLKAGYTPESIYNMDNVIQLGGFKDQLIQNNLNQLYSNVCAQDRFWDGEADFSKPDLLYGTTYWFGVATANRKGLNWKIASNVRSTVWLDTISFVPTLLQSPKKLEAAYLLADFMLSAPIQEKIHNKYGVVIVNKKVKQALSDVSEFYKEVWLWQPLTIRTQGLFSIMHNNALQALPIKRDAPLTSQSEY